MTILNRKDEQILLVDGLLVAAIEKAKTIDNSLDDADMKKLFVKRMTRLGTQRLQRGTDPNLHSRYSITLTGSV
jgi:hypothetical protein